MVRLAVRILWAFRQSVNLLAARVPGGRLSTDNAVRTAVVFVHGLLERRPMDTFDDFAKTLLAPHEGGWEYYPRPVEITDSRSEERRVGKECRL